MFEQLCAQSNAAYTSLLLHTEVRWLSRGRVLERFLSLKKELLAFFLEEKQETFANLLKDDMWILKVAYLTDIFGKFNVLNSSMQGKQETVVSSTNRIKGFLKKTEVLEGFS